MNEQAILEGIGEVARLYLGWEGVLTPEMRLVEDLRLDSIRLLTLAVEVENRFRILLDETDEGGIQTVGDLVAVVRRKLGVWLPPGLARTGGPPLARRPAVRRPRRAGDLVRLERGSGARPRRLR